MICSMRGVSVEPGNTLLTVMPLAASSAARVLAQLATAQRVVLETPRPAIGSFTEVEITLTMRPQPSRSMPGMTASASTWFAEQVLAVRGLERGDVGAVRRARRRAAAVVDEDVHRLAGGQRFDLAAQRVGVCGVGGDPAVRLAGVRPRQLRGQCRAGVPRAGRAG